MPFKPSSPAKKPCGCKAGTFDPYPKHSEDPYLLGKQKAEKGDGERKIFRPSPGPKSKPTTSIKAQNVQRYVHIHFGENLHLNIVISLFIIYT